MDQRLPNHPHPSPPPQAGEGAHCALVFSLPLVASEQTSHVSSLSRLRGRVARASARDGWGRGSLRTFLDAP
jgi:hypothetical protein